jgi:hypothetical protein
MLSAVVVAALFPDPLMRLGSIGLAVTFAFRWMVLRQTPPSLERAGVVVSAEPSLVAYREALVQRVAEDSGPRLWSRLATGVPAAGLFLYGFARSYPNLATVIALEAVAVAGGLAFAFTIAVRRARRGRAELESIDGLDGGGSPRME